MLLSASVANICNSIKLYHTRIGDSSPCTKGLLGIDSFSGVLLQHTAGWTTCKPQHTVSKVNGMTDIHITRMKTVS